MKTTIALLKGIGWIIGVFGATSMVMLIIAISVKYCMTPGNTPWQDSGVAVCQTIADKEATYMFQDINSDGVILGHNINGGEKQLIHLPVDHCTIYLD